MSMLLTTDSAATVTGGGGTPLTDSTPASSTRRRIRTASRPRNVGVQIHGLPTSAYSVVDQGESESRRMRYHFLVASAKFMLDEEEHFKELLFERLRNYGEWDKRQDFWLVIEPKFLEGFPDITRRLHRPAVALVSTDTTWITFMKLRLDGVLCDSYEADTVEEALASNATQVKFDKPVVWTAPETHHLVVLGSVPVVCCLLSHLLMPQMVCESSGIFSFVFRVMYRWFRHFYLVHRKEAILEWADMAAGMAFGDIRRKLLELHFPRYFSIV